MVLAVNNMTYRLSGYTLKNRIDVGDSNDYVLKFINKRGNEVIVYWTSANPQEISLSDNEIRGRVFSFAGQQIGFLNEENNKKLYINGSPKYILVEKSNK